MAPETWRPEEDSVNTALKNKGRKRTALIKLITSGVHSPSRISEFWIVDATLYGGKKAGTAGKFEFYGDRIKCTTEWLHSTSSEMYCSICILLYFFLEKFNVVSASTSIENVTRKVDITSAVYRGI